jgi:hypothetical protein
MATLGFDRYIEPLKTYLGKYREVRPAVLLRGPLMCGMYYLSLLSCTPVGLLRPHRLLGAVCQSVKGDRPDKRRGKEGGAP